MRSLLGRFHRPNARSQTEQLFMLNSLGDGSTLSLDFTTGALDSRLTFTRSTTGTYINSSGYVTSAAINAPRFDYDPTTLTARGLLIEGSASNILQYSVAVDQSPWFTAGGVTRTTFTGGNGPDNANNSGSKLSAVNISSSSSLYYNGVAFTSGTTYTYSVWAKADGANWIWISLHLSGAQHGAFFDLSGNGALGNTTGTVVSGSNTITKYPNGWFRLTVAHAAASTSTYFPVLLPCTSNGTGYGSISGQSPNGVLVYGAQLEVGSGASSLIPTGASTGSRAFDSCVMNDITSCKYSTTNGSMYYEGQFSKVNDASFPWRAGFTKESTDERCFGFLTNSGGSSVEAKGPGATPTASVSQTIAVNTNYKIAWSLDASLSTGEVRKSSNGSSVSVSGATALTVTGTPTYFMFGQKGYQDYFPCGTIKAFKYWPTTLSDGQLQASTT